MNRTLAAYGNLIIAASIIIVIAHFVFFVLPQTARIKRINSNLSAAQKVVAVLDDNLAVLKQLQTLQQRQTEDFSRLQVAIPVDPAIEDIYVSLDAIAARTGLTIATVTPGKVEKDEVPVDVTLSGSYEGIVDFMNSLSSNLRPVTVENVGIASSQSENQTVITASFKLEFVYAGGKAP